MNENTAYRLGKFDEFAHFYSTALWKINQEPFGLYEYFNWTIPSLYLNCRSVLLGQSNDSCFWSNIYIHGTLKTELISSLEDQIAYVSGRLNSYSVSFKKQSININYANSYNLRDFCKVCLENILNSKKEFEGKYKMIISETPNTIPGTPSIKIEGLPKVISYLKKIKEQGAEYEKVN